MITDCILELIKFRVKQLSIKNGKVYMYTLKKYLIASNK